MLFNKEVRLRCFDFALRTRSSTLWGFILILYCHSPYVAFSEFTCYVHIINAFFLRRWRFLISEGTFVVGWDDIK